MELIVPIGSAPGGIEWGTLAAKIQSDLDKVGLKVNLKQLDQSQLLNIYRKQGGQMVLILWSPDFPDPDANATPFSNYDAKSLGWRNGWNDPKAIELSKQAASETDLAKRDELYKELTDYVQHNGPYAILYQPLRVYGVRSNVEGFIFDAVDTPDLTLPLISKQ